MGLVGLFWPNANWVSTKFLPGPFGSRPVSKSVRRMKESEDAKVRFKFCEVAWSVQLLEVSNNVEYKVDEQLEWVLTLAHAIGLPIIESFKKSRSNDIFRKRISRGCGSIVKGAEDSRHYTVQSLAETLDGVILSKNESQVKSFTSHKKVMWSHVGQFEVMWRLGMDLLRFHGLTEVEG